MSKSRWSADQFKTAKLIETEKGFVKASSLVDKNPVKIEPGENTFEGNELFLEDEERAIRFVAHGKERYNTFGYKTDVTKTFNPAPVKFTPKEQSTYNGDGGNKKIKNATKTVINDITFDSKLEAYMYTLLKGAEITFERQVEYLLQPAFKYNGETVRAIKSFVDFWLPTKNIIIDTKGWQTYDGTIKFKMLKRVLLAQAERIKWEPPTIYLPATKKECDLLLNNLLYKP